MVLVKRKYLPSVAHGMAYLQHHFLEVRGNHRHHHVHAGRSRSPSAAATGVKMDKGAVERDASDIN